jgi:hypothetical protein
MSSIEVMKNRSCLVFTPSVKNAYMLAEIYGRYGAKAAAVDGTTDKNVRRDILDRFNGGDIQYLLNCNVYTEGFDAVKCSGLVMTRFTKSLNLYTQMLGRGLRVLPWVIDGLDGEDLAGQRKEAIANSEKSNCLVLDYAGLGAHKLITSYDVLGGRFDPEVLEEAKSSGRNRINSDVLEQLEKADALNRLIQDWGNRREIVADGVEYQLITSDPFSEGNSVSGPNYGQKMGGNITPKTLQLLIGMGVHPDTARNYSKRQGGLIFKKMSQDHCTEGQRNVLRRMGINTKGIGIKEASRMITAIKENGWKIPAYLRQELRDKKHGTKVASGKVS